MILDEQYLAAGSAVMGELKGWTDMKTENSQALISTIGALKSAGLVDQAAQVIAARRHDAREAAATRIKDAMAGIPELRTRTNNRMREIEMELARLNKQRDALSTEWNELQATLVYRVASAKEATRQDRNLLILSSDPLIGSIRRIFARLDDALIGGVRVAGPGDWRIPVEQGPMYQTNEQEITLLRAKLGATRAKYDRMCGDVLLRAELAEMARVDVAEIKAKCVELHVATECDQELEAEIKRLESDLQFGGEDAHAFRLRRDMAMRSDASA